MHLEFDPEFRLELLRAEAEARGVLARLRDLADRREADGLERDDAELEGAEALGLGADLGHALADALEPVSAEFARVHLRSAFTGMPTFKRHGTDASVTLPVAPFATAAALLARLAAAAANDPDRTAFWIPVGLGGSGGCACGNDLPEDAPPGPLFGG